MSIHALILTAGFVVAATNPTSDVPTFAESSGHAFGERITVSHQAEAWLHQLDLTSPRLTYQLQGHSWERRPLMLAIITSPENHARLDEIREVAQRLNDPRMTQPTAEQLARQPVIVWLGGSIHGFELSGTEGLLMLVEDLVQNDDETTRQILQNTVILLDPILNPDGRDAFAHHNHQRTGGYINALREDWANDFTFWEALSFRTGHYFFDTNRDWFAHTQRETRERMPTFLAWRPQVAIDAHEMGPDTEFYFDPPNDPVSPFFPEFATRGFELFGDAHARAFDQNNVEYTTRQMFNYFYPGYTTSWTSYQGAVGMLYEQGSSRGLALERSDGTIRTLLDAGRQQYIAAKAAVRAASDNRSQLLRDYAAGARVAVEDGRRGIRRYYIPAGADPQLTRELAELLQRNGVEVSVTRQSNTLRGLRDERGRNVGSRAIPAGSLVIEAAQPRNRLIRTLMEPHVQLPQPFLDQARARVDRGENPRFYDITAYSLPLLFNLPAYSSSDARGPDTHTWTAPKATSVPDAGYAWLVDGRQAASVAVAAHMRLTGTRVSIAPVAFSAGGHDYASGTVIIRVDDDQAEAKQRLQALADDYGVEVRGVDTGMASGGLPTVGAAETFSIRAPNVALLGDHPVQALSFGFAWHALDQHYRIPTTVVRTRSIGSTPLEAYTTLVIPMLTAAPELTTLLGESGQDRIKRWVNDGGTLVAIGSGADWVLRTLKLGSLRDAYEDQKDMARVAVPGAFARAVFDSEAWMASGYGADMPMLVNSDRVWLAPEGPTSPRQRIVARYAPRDSVRVSGHMWEENLDRLPDSVAVYEERIGRGRVILFAEDPNFRGYFRGADRLFLNAVLLAPSAP